MHCDNQRQWLDNQQYTVYTPSQSGSGLRSITGKLSALVTFSERFLAFYEVGIFLWIVAASLTEWHNNKRKLYQNSHDCFKFSETKVYAMYIENRWVKLTCKLHIMHKVFLPESSLRPSVLASFMFRNCRKPNETLWIACLYCRYQHQIVHANAMNAT